MQEYGETGLRERKKAQTRRAIERAAVDMAWEQGYEAATAEAIAAKAGVSLRTFFNYFPSKDLAIVGELLSMIEDKRALSILEDTGPKLLAGIALITEVCIATTDPDSEIRRRQCHLIHEHAPLFHLHAIADAKFDRRLTAIVATHLRAHPSRRRLTGITTVEEEARLAVTLVSSAAHHLVRGAIDKDEEVVFTARDVERTIDMLHEIYGGES